MEKIKGKLNKIKKSAKAKVEKIKNYIKENIFIIISWSQFILTIVMTILLICSLIMTTNLSKQLDDISKQTISATSSADSQESTESDTNISSEVESETETDDEPSSSTTSSSTESTDTSSDISSTTTSSSNSSSNNSSSKKPTSSTVKTGTTTDLDLLACVIYQEAGGNECCDDCRRRVADVVLNRVEDPRFPNTIREVLTAKNQYGRFYYTGIKWPNRSKNYYERDAIARAYRIAEEVLNGQHSELYGNGYIWQAGFKQGTSQIYCCGHYFGK